jgi:hypothetical protein
MDDAAGELLFRHINLDRAVAGLAVGVLQGLESPLDVAVDPLAADEGRHGALDLGFGQQGVAVHLEADDVEMDVTLGRQGTGRNQGGKEEACPSGPHDDSPFKSGYFDAKVHQLYGLVFGFV